VRLQRTVLGTSGKPTFGKLTSNDGKFFCYTLERPVDGDHPCIPAGLVQGHDRRCIIPGTPGAYRCPELMNVPGRSQIQIHIANRVVELLGCIAPGERIGAIASKNPAPRSVA
jgi:hypothetical protein